jgi:acetyl esterase/lipase
LLTVRALGTLPNAATFSRLAHTVSGQLDPSSDGVRRLTLTYARGLRAYVFAPAHFNPATDGGLPALAFFFGGGLVSGSPSFWFPTAAYFAQRGFIAVSFQYRLDGAGGASLSISDARTALRWMRAVAPLLGINPGAIAAVGNSAGGYLALMTALGGNQPDELYLGEPVAPNAIIAIAPIIAGSPTFPLPASLTVTDLAASERLPPTLILQGTDDELTATPFSVTVGFAANRSDTVLVPFPGLTHATIAAGNHLSVDLLVLAQFLEGEISPSG